MPKLKSNRAAAKRFKPTGTGRFKHRQSFKNHILTKKSSKRKRQLRGLLTIHAADQKAVRQMLPYSRGKSAFRSPHPSPLPEGEGTH